MAAAGSEPALATSNAYGLLGQGYLPCWMRRALMGCVGAALESRRAMVLAVQNGERDGRSGVRV